MKRDKVLFALFVTLWLLAMSVLYTHVDCDQIDRVGNKHNCTVWTGWAEF